MELLELLEAIIDSMAEDSLSPIPGMFTLATILQMVMFRGYEGKGKRGNLSSRQIGIIKSLLNDYFETKRAGRTTYYGSRKRW